MADRALILGINEYKSVNHLRGCVNDAEAMRSLLVDVFNFPESNVEVLTDKQVVKAAVMRKLARLFVGARPGDRVVLHFSGHGSYVDDKNGDEPDGRDEILALYDMDFEDSGTYILDDELRKWTQTKPEGVELVVVLDNCNSGTGTRMLFGAGPGEPGRAAEIDPQATVMRSVRPAARGLEAAPTAASALRPDSDQIVLVRFLDPPDDVKERVRRAASTARRRGLREIDQDRALNHVLLAACRADQTAADATIEGKPCGAFTHYLTGEIRADGAAVDRKALIEKVERALADAQFAQVPQLEGPEVVGPLFTSEGAKPRPGSRPTSTSARPSEDVVETGTTDSLMALVERLAPLDSESRKRVLDLYERAIAAPRAAGRAAVAPAAGEARHLVYVHGICRHDAGYSDGWWDALHPFTTAFGAGTRGDTRLEVLWSDLVNARGLEARAVSGRRAELAEQIRETLRDRIDRHALESGPRSMPGEAPRALADTRGLLSIPGLNCIDDFVVYLTEEATRAAIIGRFTEVVRPLLQANVEVDIISHSWGTVVAYEGLRELAAGGLTTPLVRNYFTVGAALSIGAVKQGLRPQNKDGARPAMARRWVNLDAHGDPVGGALQGRPYEVDFDFPNLVAFNCSSFLGLVSPGCAHGSYFVDGNDAVNRDIFAAFIDRP